MFSWRNIVNTINAVGSPKQAINLLLKEGEKKDPNLANALRQIINSGEDPAKVLRQLSSEGKISLKNLAQIKNYYDIARRMGMKQQIPNSEWQAAEKAIRDGTKNGFGGF